MSFDRLRTTHYQYFIRALPGFENLRWIILQLSMTHFTNIYLEN